MIFYLVKQENSNTLRSFLATWGKNLRPVLEIVTYEKLWRAAFLKKGAYIFSDIERLSAAETELAAAVWKKLHDTWGDGIRLCNHPTRCLDRFELLRALHEKGTNDFNVHRLENGGKPRRFPLFIRNADDHDGALTGLLQTPAELAEALARLDDQGQSRKNKLLVEYCHTADSGGVYRKYSCFLVNGKVIPRHLCFDRDWVLKIASDNMDFSTPEMLAEELRFVSTNPHERQVREIFTLAQIDYGRIDYALKDGRIQVWEINTNPWIVSFLSLKTDERHPVHEVFLDHFIPAMRNMDPGAKAGKVKNPAQTAWRRKRLQLLIAHWGQTMLYALPVSLAAKARLHERWLVMKKKFFPGWPGAGPGTGKRP